MVAENQPEAMEGRPERRGFSIRRRNNRRFGHPRPGKPTVIYLKEIILTAKADMCIDTCAALNRDCPDKDSYKGRSRSQREMK
jgi:hypothetical protein